MLELPCIVQILMIFATKSYIYMYNFTFSISCLSRFIKEHSKYDLIFPAPIITVRALEIAHKFLFDSLFTY